MAILDRKLKIAEISVSKWGMTGVFQKKIFEQRNCILFTKKFLYDNFKSASQKSCDASPENFLSGLSHIYGGLILITKLN